MLSSSNIMALKRDLYFLRDHLRNLRENKEDHEREFEKDWKKQLTNVFSKTHSKQMCSLNHEIDRLEAIIHIYSKAMLLAMPGSKGGNEDEFKNSLSKLDVVFKVEIFNATIHCSKVYEIAKRIELLNNDVTWEKLSKLIPDSK